jgi:hypothetical protein
MAKKNQLFVVKSGDEWKVKRANAERASFVADTQEEA